MSDVKICWKARVSESFYSNFWEERGEKLMICHLLLDNFLEISWLLGDFKGYEFWNEFLFQEDSDISNLISWNVRLFWIFVFRKRRVISEIWLCFRACNSRIVTCDQEFVMWCDFCVLITVTESFEKFPKEVMVLSKTCVRFRNRIFKGFE